MKLALFLAPLLAFGVSIDVQAGWSGSQVLNDVDRVQVIGENIYVNLNMKRDFSFLVNVPLSSGNPEEFNPKNIDISKFGSCPFNAIDMSEYDNAVQANDGNISQYAKDKARENHVLKLVKERNHQSHMCRMEREARAKNAHDNITLNSIALQENELDQTNTETYRVVTTGSDKAIITGRIDNCLSDCIYTNTKTTVMFELDGNAYIVSLTQREPDKKFFKITKKYLDTNTVFGSNTKVVPMSLN
ncbi:hypothetical protein MCT08_18500 [Vibrio aestuarianus]|uniref:hypothetical protein n=1 Tax=Vibrio aestuarianus TaxID=28171 RepID=UPI00237D19D4|nr:hypothetical protein [Vibrio aestuarianus]MDE1251556.1 hypothetical protein [Vibrio aestuarianus]